MCSACPLMVFNICVKFHENISSNFKLMEQTKAITPKVGKPELWFMCSIVAWCLQCRTQGGAKGAHAPPNRPRVIPCPRKKNLKKMRNVMQKIGTSVSLIPARLQSVKMVGH